MAAPKVDTAAQCKALIQDARSGIFKPVYLLMGDEPFYPEAVCDAIIENCIDESFRDFNQTVVYGADVTAQQIADAASQYPMMTDRLLVVVKEAQMCKSLESLSVYCEHPLESTVLVLLMHGASADRRKALYKAVQKNGVVVDSPMLRDYEVPRWISSYYQSLGLRIDPQAAALMAESLGTSLSTIAVETDKLKRNLPEGATEVTVQDVEKNVGISREYSVFELTKALSEHNSPRALMLAARIGSAARFAMPMAVSALFNHFNRILRYGNLLAQGGSVSPEAKSAALSGVNPYFYREYDTAVRYYPVPKAMAAISLLCEFDYLAKGGKGGDIEDGELLVELTAKLLNL
ncbi:MAG: DNA polymerase III subunit delta [Bacteroidales bacterium]|nr:DNA polymerase III subunit delta [Candidatus Cryptobacteroides aphodequi]